MSACGCQDQLDHFSESIDCVGRSTEVRRSPSEVNTNGTEGNNDEYLRTAGIAPAILCSRKWVQSSVYKTLENMRTWLAYHIHKSVRRNDFLGAGC